MNGENMEIILYLVIILFALWLWSKKPSGSKAIESKQAKAKDRLDRFFNKLTAEEKSYGLLIKVSDLFYAGVWKPISKEKLESNIMQDCIRSTGVSRTVSDARFSLSRSPESQAIYCVVGIDNFNFTKFHNE